MNWTLNSDQSSPLDILIRHIGGEERSDRSEKIHQETLTLQGNLIIVKETVGGKIFIVGGGKSLPLEGSIEIRSFAKELENKRSNSNYIK